ncbi:hypothetical protein N7536_007109 [Penicillium majusculum]|uniref:Uncharacterized protein n=1 Tax=Penicillium solitum TaxID=60172 RepID=A0A1V6RLZ3_9EURO|nr:uncharacterized protein PENSOL_c002G03686 [Penicillium solitum]KAJ5696697.1 hypothetical protein N7536_007109 [Penicillium majusculum]OQE02439.1 hypothetical protein PENSOL_c002G03686 [Penicillium solitum]
MWPSISTLLALPILGLISIPLILSAWVTISAALFALLLRLSVVCIELFYGLVMHFFSVPTSSTSSLLTFAASEPTTPAAGRSRRNSSQTTTHPRKTNDPLNSWGIGTSLDDPANRKRNSYARSMIEAHNLSTQTPVYSLPISGDERRDFEGVGGWRSYRTSKTRSLNTPHEKATSSTSSSSTNSTGDVDPDADIDADERAWLSLNNRLELPSQLVTLCTSVHAGSTLTSPESADWRNGRSNFQSRTGATGSQDIYPEKQKDGSRHHHRSLTTSSLTTSDRRTGTGLSIALSTRPDNVAVHSREYGQSMLSSTARPTAPFMTPQPYARLDSNSLSQSRVLPRTFNASGAPFTSSYLSSFGDGLGQSFGSNSSGGSLANGGGGGYFSLRRPGSSGSHILSGRVSPSTSGYNTPAVGLSTEERDASSVGLARLMAHYPTSPRHRRQSISGPNSRGLAAGDRAG